MLIASDMYIYVYYTFHFKTRICGRACVNYSVIDDAIIYWSTNLFHKGRFINKEAIKFNLFLSILQNNFRVNEIFFFSMQCKWGVGKTTRICSKKGGVIFLSFFFFFFFIFWCLPSNGTMWKDPMIFHHSSPH